MELTNLKNKLALTETTLFLTQEELRKTKQELKYHKIKVTEDQMKTNERLHEKNESIQKLERELSQLKDTPWTYVCAAQDYISIVSQAISYDQLLYSSNNVEGTFLDISTGAFTSGHS